MMVLKRCLYFFLSIWLINAVVCFHAENTSTPLPNHIQYPGETCKDGDTVLEYVTQVFDTDDQSNSDNSSNQSRRVARKILPRRIAEFNAQLPILIDFIKGNVGTDLHRTYGTLWFNKAFLPGYYHFLFRFKPF